MRNDDLVARTLIEHCVDMADSDTVVALAKFRCAFPRLSCIPEDLGDKLRRVHRAISKLRRLPPSAERLRLLERLGAPLHRDDFAHAARFGLPGIMAAADPGGETERLVALRLAIRERRVDCVSYLASRLPAGRLGPFLQPAMPRNVGESSECAEMLSLLLHAGARPSAKHRGVLLLLRALLMGAHDVADVLRVHAS